MCHAEIKTTARVYADFTQVKKKAANKIDNVLRRATSPSNIRVAFKNRFQYREHFGSIREAEIKIAW